jgi:hypothetical protein
MGQMAHSPLKNPEDNVLLPYWSSGPTVDGDAHSPHNIELDCPPFQARPWDLLPGIIEGTGLVFENPEKVGAFFGAATYEFPGTTCEQWAKAQELLIPRIKALYYRGAIRHGSW